MIKKHKNLLTHDECELIMYMYRSLSNTVIIDDQVRDRHYPSAVGHFMISEFSADEFASLWDSLSTRLNNEYKLIYTRVLKYNRTCHIPEHVDGFTESQQPNDVSLICQLCEPSSYIGGEMIVSQRQINLEKGDAVYYTYDHEHAVNYVEKGVRYVLNLRLKKVK